jgi:O-antigen/teichoic acid export membrane protein
MFNSRIRLQRLAKEGFWIVLGQVVAVMGSIIGVKILTEMLDPTAYGELALVMILNTTISQTIFSPLSAGVLRFYAAAVENKELGSYLKTVLRGLILVTVGLVIVSILLGIPGLLILNKLKWIGILGIALLLSIASGWNTVLSNIQHGARQRSIVAFHQALDPWARLMIACVIMTWFGHTSFIALTGYLLGVVLVLTSQYMFFRGVVSNQLAPSIGSDGTNWYQNIWSFSWPFTVWGLFTAAQIASDRWALGSFATTKEVGLYIPLFQLGYYPISLATGMAMTFLEPIFFQRSGDGSDRQRNATVNRLGWNVTFLALSLTGLSCCFAFIFHGQIFQIFVAKEYTSVSYLLPWMMLSGGVFAAGQTISLNMMSQMQTRKIMLVKITTALLGIGLNFVGAYLYGTIGIVIASILFSASYFIWTALLSK